MDEVTVYCARKVRLNAAYKDLLARFKLTYYPEVVVHLGEKWHYVHRPCKDRAPLTTISLSEDSYGTECANINDADDFYVLTEHAGDYGQIWCQVFEKALQDPDVVMDCRYLVVYRRAEETLWCAPYHTFREAEDHAYQEAAAYLNRHGLPINPVERAPDRNFYTVVFNNYITDLGGDVMYSIDPTEQVDIFITCVDYREEPYPHEWQEVAQSQ